MCVCLLSAFEEILDKTRMADGAKSSLKCGMYCTRTVSNKIVEKMGSLPVDNDGDFMPKKRV